MAIDELTPTKRGGARAGSGPKPADGRRGMTRRNVMLDDETVAWLRELGDGELSLGIRRAAAALRQQLER